LKRLLAINQKYKANRPHHPTTRSRFVLMIFW
jgi:hypothetical protein